MPLRLADRWIWDFWLAVDGDDVHVFYLQAPRSLGDPELRHRNATIGHAVSRDLRNWRVLPDALGPGPAGAFDDLATWTGSVIPHDGAWHMFYTGVSRAEDGAVQRVGLARSEDLVTWDRQGAVLEADPRWYARHDWRDPWVEWDPDDGQFHMIVCASVSDGPADGRGVIGHATSPDLRSWIARPPVSAPGEFGMLEVPQRAHVGGAWRILFCTTAHHHSAARRARSGMVAEWGTHYLTGASRHGPFTLDRDDFLAGDPTGTTYAGRLLHHRGDWQFLAWRLHDEHGRFVGELADPRPVHVRPDGSLALADAPGGMSLLTQS
jgi:beta-fructofuranosidase